MDGDEDGEGNFTMRSIPAENSAPSVAAPAAALFSVFDDAAGAMSALVTDDGEAMKCFRIPAVAQTGNGTLVAFAEGRTSKKCLDSTSREIMFRRSMDGGKTFGEVAIAAGNSTYPVRVAGPIPSRASLPPRLTPFISET